MRSRSGAVQLLVRDQSQSWFERPLASLELGDFGAIPDHTPGPCQRKGIVRRIDQPAGPLAQLVYQHLSGGMTRGLALQTLCRRVRGEVEAGQSSDEMAFHMDLAVLADLGEEAVLVAHTLHQSARAAIDEALRQALMQRVRKAVFDFAGLILPMALIGKPVRTIGDECPGPDMGNAIGDRVDVPVGSIRQRDLLGEPVFGNEAGIAHQGFVDGGQQIGMRARRDLSIVGNLADFPKPFDCCGSNGHGLDFIILGESLEGLRIVRLAGTDEAIGIGCLAQAIA